ncbi:tetratricopeptide repeat protein [Maribacter sp. 2210JD10-5]|uniref:tetratricopeptide repeat-containing sensor histidine kinase n=1 Tax=Maribacter sp. 2210JD10-5 TaxID=3386272 RepID=UPI0039BD3A30
MITETIQKTILSFLFFFVSFLGISQEKELDSLLRELKLNQEQDSSKVNILLGIAQKMRHSNPGAAFLHVDKAIDISSDLNWQKGLGLSYTQKGNLYYIVADNLNALDAFQKALDIGQKTGDESLKLSMLNNLANIHADLKEYDEALEKYGTFLSTSENLGNVPNQIRGLTNIAIVYTDSDRHEEAVSYLKKALRLSKEEKNDFFIAAITNNLALAYKGMGAYQKALEFYQIAVDISRKIENNYIEASALNSIGKVNILLKNYDKALISGEEALKLSEEIGAVEWQADSWKVLSTVYEEQNKMEDALTAYKNHIKFRDSVLNEEKKSEITKKEMQFKMKMQQDVANEEIKQQKIVKNGYLVGAVLLMIFAIAGYFFYKRRRDILEEKKIADFNTKVAETELKALRSQMNPHFIFNSLSSISDFMVKNDIEKANEYLIKFAKLTRSILENSEKKWITLKEDLELMELYIQIEAIRLKNKLTHTISVGREIDVENTLVPPLMLQPFIENSIWHGIAKNQNGGHINIETKKEGDLLVCSVDDNGVGRTKNVKLKSENTSMGIRITKNRLDILSRLKETKGNVVLIDKTQGLRVELKLPLELQF